MKMSRVSSVYSGYSLSNIIAYLLRLIGHIANQEPSKLFEECEVELSADHV